MKSDSDVVNEGLQTAYETLSLIEHGEPVSKKEISDAICAVLEAKLRMETMKHFTQTAKKGNTA
jgi:hypothetical protein